MVPPGVDYRCEWGVAFRQMSGSPSIAKAQFRSICTASIAQALLPPETSDCNALKVALKPWDTWHPSRRWPRDLLVDTLLRPWQRASRHTGEQFVLRAISGGKQLINEQRLDAYLPASHTAEDTLRIHFVTQQHGGGSKLDAHHRLKQQAVEFLLQWGANPAEVNTFVQDLYEKAGVARFQHIMAIEDGEEKIAQIQRLAQAMHVKHMQFEDLQAERQKKFKTWRPKPFVDQTLIRAENFSIAPKSFALDDGSDAACLSCTSTIREGVMLADAACVGDVVRNLSTRPNAFAVCVVGAECPTFTTPCQTIHVPALDKQGVQVIVKACLHQFGQRKIQLRTTSGDDVTVHPSCLAAITAWKAEMKEDLWASLLTSPAKTCAQVLCITPSEQYSTSPWGRNFRNADQSCVPEDASSFQFHCRIKQAAIELLMKHSGKEGVHLTPKSETLNRADEKYSVIWQPDATFEQVREFADSVEHQLGIARSTTGSLHYGVRVHIDHFPATFAKAFPRKTIPPMLVTNFLAKIAPAPTGASSENVRAWLAVRGIKGKPIRALNTSTWLISTVEKPVRAFHTWGNNSVLLSPVTPKNERSRPTIVAGQSKQEPSWKSLASLDDELQGLGDPWAHWASSSTGSASSRLSSEKSTAEPSIRAQTQLSAQQVEITTINKEKFNQREKTDASWKTAIARDMKAFKAEVKHDFQQLEAKHQSTFEAALANTEAKITQSMQSSIMQLQQFMVDQAKMSGKRPQPPSPAKSSPGDTEMQQAS